jgi:hypothetical protein
MPCAELITAFIRTELPIISNSYPCLNGLMLQQSFRSIGFQSISNVK